MIVQSSRDHRFDLASYKWSKPCTSQEIERSDENQTPGRRNVTEGVLSGNTLLTNCDSSEFQPALKAPRKERKPMKKSKRFKIFGAMKNVGTRNKNGNQGLRESELKERQYDEHTLGRRRFLRDFEDSDCFEHRNSAGHGLGGRHSNGLETIHHQHAKLEIQDHQNDFDWDDEDLKFLSKSIGDESDLSNIDPHMYGSRSHSQSTHRSFAGSNSNTSKNCMHVNRQTNRSRVPVPIPHPRSRSHSNSRSGAKVSRTHFVQKLQKAESAALNAQLTNQTVLNRSRSINHSGTTVDNSRSKSLSTDDSSSQQHTDNVKTRNIQDKYVFPSRKIIAIPSRKYQSKSNDERKLHHIRDSSRSQKSEDHDLCESQSHVSALSMTSPTEASNKRILAQMLSISFSENENSSKIKPPMNDKIDKSFMPNFFCGIPNIKLQHGLVSEDSSSDSSSDSPHSSVVEIVVQDDVLPSTSSLTSQSTDIQDSEDSEDDEDDDIECCDNNSGDDQNDPVRGGQEPSKYLLGTRKMLTVIQGKLSDCFMPAMKSPPSSLYCKSKFF